MPSYSCYSDDSHHSDDSTRIGLRAGALIRAAGALLAAAAFVVGSAAGAAGQPAEAPAPSRVPPNLSAPEALRQLVAAVAEQSATFRNQCARIAATPGLLVIMREAPPWADRRFAAVTTIRRHEDGAITALVELHRPVNVVEHVAHEFEHVIEQIEGVNLRRLSVRKARGVFESSVNTFETRRAVEAGRRVAREFRAALARAVAVPTRFGRLTARLTVPASLPGPAPGGLADHGVEAPARGTAP